MGIEILQALSYGVELRQNQLCVRAVLVKISPQRGAVSLVVIVRAANANVGTAGNGPGQQVSINNGTVGGQEESKILLREVRMIVVIYCPENSSTHSAHSENLLCGLSELSNRGHSVVRKVVARLSQHRQQCRRTRCLTDLPLH